FRDGTRYRIEAGMATMRDRNGNMMKFDFVPGTNNLIITDSINRQITVNRISESFMQWREEITYLGAAGSPRTIIIRVRPLSQRLRSGYTPMTLHQLFPETDGADGPYDAEVISEVVLPDQQRSYQLYYNPYGELARVEMPTGGAIEYDWGAGGGGGSGSGWYSTDIVYRRVLVRRVYPNGGGGNSYESKNVYLDDILT